MKIEAADLPGADLPPVVAPSRYMLCRLNCVECDLARVPGAVRAMLSASACCTSHATDVHPAKSATNQMPTYAGALRDPAAAAPATGRRRCTLMTLSGRRRAAAAPLERRQQLRQCTAPTASGAHN